MTETDNGLGGTWDIFLNLGYIKLPFLVASISVFELFKPKLLQFFFNKYALKELR